MLRALRSGRASPRVTNESIQQASMQAEIERETGEHARALLRLINARAPGVSALNATRFILEKWNAGGEDRERLIAHANKDQETINAERRLAVVIQKALKPFAGENMQRRGPLIDQQLRMGLFKLLRPMIPKLTANQLRDLIGKSIDYTDDSLNIQTTLFVRVMLQTKG